MISILLKFVLEMRFKYYENTNNKIKSKIIIIYKKFIFLSDFIPIIKDNKTNNRKIIF